MVLARGAAMVAQGSHGGGEGGSRSSSLRRRRRRSEVAVGFIPVGIDRRLEAIGDTEVAAIVKRGGPASARAATNATSMGHAQPVVARQPTLPVSQVIATAPAASVSVTCTRSVPCAICRRPSRPSRSDS